MIIEYFPQGSAEWFAARRGVITMSHAGELLTKGAGVTRRNYLMDVLAERLTDAADDEPPFVSRDMLRGIELEPYALKAYAAETGAGLQSVGLGYLDKCRRISASPDGITGASGAGGAEIKCPRPRAHIRYLDSAVNMKKYMPQIQGNMWVFGAEWWDFVSFCPEVPAHPLYIQRIERDNDFIFELAASADRAVAEIDEMESAARQANPTEQTLTICRESRAVLDALFGDDTVVPS